MNISHELDLVSDDAVSVADQLVADEGADFGRQVDAVSAAYYAVKQLAKVRLELGLTQQDVADALGTSQPAIARLESLQHEPRLSTLARYAALLGRQLSFVSPEGEVVPPAPIAMEHAGTVAAAPRSNRRELGAHTLLQQVNARRHLALLDLEAPRVAARATILLPSLAAAVDHARNLQAMFRRDLLYANHLRFSRVNPAVDVHRALLAREPLTEDQGGLVRPWGLRRTFASALREAWRAAVGLGPLQQGDVFELSSIWAAGLEEDEFGPHVVVVLVSPSPSGAGESAIYTRWLPSRYSAIRPTGE